MIAPLCACGMPATDGDMMCLDCTVELAQEEERAAHLEEHARRLREDAWREEMAGRGDVVSELGRLT